MAWDSFVKNVEDTFSFLRGKDVSDNFGNTGCIHPLITHSAFLAHQVINQKQMHSNRLIILLPNKFTIPHWATSIVMLKALKSNYEENHTQQLVFKKGEKLLFANKCVVGYVCHELIDGQPYIKVKCSQECYWLIPENKELSFERTNCFR